MMDKPQELHERMEQSVNNEDEVKTHGLPLQQACCPDETLVHALNAQEVPGFREQTLIKRNSSIVVDVPNNDTLSVSSTCPSDDHTTSSTRSVPSPTTKKDAFPSSASGPRRIRSECQSSPTDTDMNTCKDALQCLAWSGFQKKKGRLYGRSQEMKQLQECFSRRYNDNLPMSSVSSKHANSTTATTCKKRRRQPELLLVSGPSGTGKTMLVDRSLRPLVEQKGGYFLNGKFDQLYYKKSARAHDVALLAEPYAPFVAILTQLVLAMEVGETKAVLARIRQELLHQIGFMGVADILVALVPVVGRLLGGEFGNNNDDDPDHHHHQNQGEEPRPVTYLQQERLKTAITKFFVVVCSLTKKPIVLCLDDLQWSWADNGSLRLLETLIAPDDNDTTANGLMVIGICRSNEVAWHHSFASMLRNLEDVKNTTIHHVQVGNLSLEATHEMLSDLLEQSPGPLAEILHERTQGGNSFFLVQLLKALLQKGVLAPRNTSHSPTNNNVGNTQWFWDDNRWEELTKGESTLDVVELVSQQILRLSPPCQQLLNTMASIGAEVDYDIIVTTLGNDVDGHSLKDVLEMMVEEQIIVEQLPHRPGRYAFVHDRFQEASLSLVPEALQPELHLSIGLKLFHNLLAWELNQHMFLVVNQLFYGASLLTREEDKNGLAALCARAGKKATQGSDFETARKYFGMGVSLLPKRHWRDEYHLSLDLFCSRAEAECCASDFESMHTTIEEVLSNCRSESDKLRPLQIRIFALGMQCQFHQGLELGLSVMSSLGERFPSKPSIPRLVPQLLEIICRLSSLSDQDIMDLPREDMYNFQMQAKAAIVNAVGAIAFGTAPKLFPFIIVRGIKLTLRNGLSEYSSLVFAGYALMMCAIGDYKQGCRYSCLALKLLGHFPNTPGNIAARTKSIANSLLSWKLPLRPTLEPLQEAVKLASESSDTECAMITGYVWTAKAYYAGLNLCIVDQELRQYMSLMSKQGPWLALTMVQGQLVELLMGRSENAVLKFDMDPKNQQPQDFNLYNYTYWFCQLQLAYHLGELKLARESARKCRKFMDEVSKAYLCSTGYFFYDALTALEAARVTKRSWRRRIHIARAKIMLSKLTKLAKLGPDNIVHKVHILRGELEAMNGNFQAAMKHYRLGASHASENGYAHMEALATERAAAVLQQFQVSAAESKEMAKRAINLYRDWGATAIVAHLLKKLDEPEVCCK